MCIMSYYHTIIPLYRVNWQPTAIYLPLSRVAKLPSAADVCLLAGVICVHDWLRRVSLDGNPIDEDGLGYLCRALLKNGSVQSVSLNRCAWRVFGRFVSRGGVTARVALAPTLAAVLGFRVT